MELQHISQRPEIYSIARGSSPKVNSYYPTADQVHLAVYQAPT
jgi:hypothetical protein